MSRLGEWEAVLSGPGTGRTTLAVAPSNQRVVYALSASNDAGPDGHFEQALLAVYRSTAAGNPGSWRVRVDNTDPEKLNTCSSPTLPGLPTRTAVGARKTPGRRWAGTAT
jgi:hypothetical protein